jgi:hypothetical protein
MKRKNLLSAIRLMAILRSFVPLPLERRNLKGATRLESAGKRHRRAIMECLAEGVVRSCNSLPPLFAAVMQIRRICSMVVLTLGTAVMGATPLAAQSGCQVVDDALNKVMTVPTHIYTAMSPGLSNGSTPRPSDTIHNETIYVGGSAYVKVSGKWSRSEWPPQRIMKQEQENRQQSKTTCRYLRDELVDGEAAAVYGAHAERSHPDTKSDGQIWISKSRGLPLRDEMDIDAGDGSRHHHSTHYEYTNVQPPL